MTVPTISTLGYQKDSCNLFSALLNESWPILLDSAHPYAQQGRYDIMAANPIATYTALNGHIYHSQHGNTQRLDGSLFDHLKKALSPYHASSQPLPFCGGLLGYFGYDLAWYLDSLPMQRASSLTIPDMAMGLYEWAIVTDHDTQLTYLVSCGQADHNALYIRAQEWMQAKPEKTSNHTVDLSTLSSSLPQAEYTQAFNQIKRYLANGDCYQVNLAQCLTVDYSGSSWSIYQKLRAVNHAPFSAYFSTPSGDVLSYSPERFINCSSEGYLSTSPIKGTRPRSECPIEDNLLRQSLSMSDKDRAENLMIVDLLRNDLSKVAKVGSVGVTELFGCYSFPAVHHLVSTIEARLKNGLTALDALEACFPGGSITGAPKRRAMEIINELEPVRRTIYTGSLGYISCDGKMDTNIAIRTLVAENQRIHCWAGGGIVMDSEPESEYQETFDKIAKILGHLH